VTDRLRELKELLRELVALDTTSSRSNVPAIALIERELQAVGFRCERQAWRDADGQEKVNLIAQLGPTGTPELALVGHTDCVPFDPAWRVALTLVEQDGKLLGRGACDTKAFVACTLVAVRGLKADTLTRPLALIFTADEEVGLLGAKKLVEEDRGKARYAIVGEPTSLRPIRGHKGYCLAEIEVSGKEGHSAYPESGASAIFRAARLVRAIETYALGPLRAKRDAAFDPPFTTLNVGMLSGGRAKNIIPGRCQFMLEWRPIPSEGVEDVLRDLQVLIAEQRTAESGFDAKVLWTRTDPGVNTPESSPLVQFLCQESGESATTVPFSTEAPQLTQLGAEAVVFGPGDIRVAHQSGEFVPIEELVRAEAILRNAIAHFCGAKSGAKS
jgi:acetylornithine deacetylase